MVRSTDFTISKPFIDIFETEEELPECRHGDR
uniref:Uncharacterized protein n=1 Tax=Candidatus Kentrum sp. TC TaxID=2126339 RepID=A0A450ZC97_9GAMM|nr:MAG: hypothetical protein BECKTC1821D_GA0114238_100124 [Candidatus Kentron sp. TC]VFK37759.1 MAG: hypothetical protein BECKTC1821E_GA0114239_100191 [Candidatus Kentron sp. TC]VFK51414.1 MAG: hypothetical protein BECKTC1821F_GA0114240_100186 [Candidatus Kentron sp. TC]